jgi:hypothetical protein
MSVNKYKPHVWIIPEDDANRQLIIGFRQHYAVSDQLIGVSAPAGGWLKVLEVFETEYIRLLRQFTNAHVILLIDFDDDETRRNQSEYRIPEDIKSRAFIIGSKVDPESLKRELGMTLEKIGDRLAQECLDSTSVVWQSSQLLHNTEELSRLIEFVRPILFE